jgi:hypothetical protein
MDLEMTRPMRRVARGLGFVFAGVALLVITWSAAFLVDTLKPTQTLTIGLVFAWAIWFAVVLHLVGQLQCLWVPVESDARGPLWVALVLNVLAKALTIGDLVVIVLQWWQYVGPLPTLSTLGLVLSVISSLSYLVFLKRLCRYLGYGDGVIDAEGLLFLWGLMIFFGLLLLGVLLGLRYWLPLDNFMEALNSPLLEHVVIVGVVVVLGLTFAILALITLIKYSDLLTGLRDLIRREAASAAQKAPPKKGGLASL